MEELVLWYQLNIEHVLPKELFVFFVSMLPLIELRGGLLASSLLNIPLVKANLICITGNIIPIPFILLFIKKIFVFMKKHNIMTSVIEKLERRAIEKSSGIEKGEIVFLTLFVGIPFPGTGAWTASLIAAMLETDIKKVTVAIIVGLLIATIIMDLFSYGVLGRIIQQMQ